MSIFQAVSVSWQGQTFTVPANRVLGAIASVEGVITLHELQAFAQRGTAPTALIAQAFGALLRYAGANCTDEEVYAGMFTSGNTASVLESVMTLLRLMVPPVNFPAGSAEGNASPAAGKRSKKRSK